ncbi:RHS repeat domain-containing protein [Flavitalea sp. BT771]|uniref:RHS repeat domain-containing protein n=1 Tax=Flavitalea sp. BT771 TaxID=3063329 RepID=UPI0026E24439|nr:RHS repeat domain-containing protein [Flavitalea sp. BT771]MDO6433189.1 RHS repeat domain-containing protein [Flavitalea sp. BT771]MDV6221535.1 RHS repeat domain-containing protein [Flavitalea sp. BT771]
MRKLLLATLLFPVAIATAQTAAYQSNKIVQASPTSASLGRFGNVEVSPYNGSPNISVPLYSVKTTGHSLHLSLRYDASGTKALQDASWVGLGWTLQAGGAITRIVRCQDDFIEHGYFFAANLPPNNPDNSWQATSNWQNDINYFNSAYNGQMDLEPDVFSYNFNGYSGRLVLGKNANGAPVFMDDRNNLKVEYLYATGNWRITTPEGYRYYFATSERTQGYNYSSPIELTNMTGVSGLNFDVNTTPTTAWYLDSIVAPSLEKVTFTYAKGKSLGLINKSEQVTQMIAWSLSCPQPPSGFNSQEHLYMADRQAIQDVYLKKISFINGSVEFNASPRNDIEYINSVDTLWTPSKLDNIVIKNVAGTEIKRFSFFYTYFNQANISGRLKLDSIKESGGSLSKPPYAFTYINPGSLPDKYTRSIDHWGYYNGAVNPTLLPTTTIPLANQSFTGANRDPDTLQNYPMNGMLSNIKYPTGGSTSFGYELNDYGNLHGAQQFRTLNKFAMVRANPDINPTGDVTSADFYIHGSLPDTTLKVAVVIQCSYQKVNPNVSDLPSLGYTNMWKVADDGSVTSIADCSMANYDQPNPSPTFTNMNLWPGHYRIYLQSISGWSTFMSVSWQESDSVPLLRRKGGGVRIQSVTDQDDQGNTIVKAYKYMGNDGRSSGVLMSPNEYAYIFTTYSDGYINGSNLLPNCFAYVQFYGLASSSVYPSGLSSRTGIVGYSKVTELQGPNGENGRTEYYYHNVEPQASIHGFIPTVPDPMNGKLDSSIVYNAQGQVVSRSDNTWQVKEDLVLKGVKLFVGKSDPAFAGIYNIYYYDNRSSWVVPGTEKQTLYDGAGKITTAKTFYYDNNVHREPTRIDVSMSDGSLTTTKYKRPGDYTITGIASTSIAQGIQNLQNNYIITPVIEQYSQRSNTDGSNLRTVAASFTSYKPAIPYPDVIYRNEMAQPLTDFAPSVITGSAATLDGRYKPYLVLDCFDPQGNIIQKHDPAGNNYTYIWDYQKVYPIAEILNADSLSAAYTSFEADGLGGWTLTGGSTISNSSVITGSHICSGGVTKTVPAGNYVVGLWATGSPTVNGQTATALLTSKKDASWHYYEWKLTNVTSVQVTGSNMDEVRLYPAAAQMSTYTYDPLIGMTTKCDVAGRITYYEYDGLGRLKVIRDQDGNIVKTIQYHYKGQPLN